MEKLKKKETKFGIGIILCIFLCIYLGISAYFTNRFCFGTIINSVNVSGKTVKEAEKKIYAEVKTYTLQLQERNNVKEQIKGTDINLKYNPNGEIKKLKDKQNSFMWILSLFNKEKFETTEEISYDEELLNNIFNGLSCFDSRKIIEPKSPVLEYKENGYVIHDEIYGNKVKEDTLYSYVVESITTGKKIIYLELSSCYEEPRFTSRSKEVYKAKNILDKYTSSKITYNFGNRTEVLEGSTISTWLSVDENFQVVIDEKKVNSYILKLSSTYSTLGKKRQFVTSLGITVEVGGGNYGWLIDKTKEKNALISDIKNGENITKEPIYAQTAVSHDENDIGNTYVEINMSRQHLWFYKDGSLIVAGDIVTGNVSRNNSTPVGVFRLNYKQKDATLKGENYESSVKFWMPFYGNVGMHDASWRSSFGGKIYRTNGSHGCVNLPYYVASSIFNLIEEGTPIICYYEEEQLSQLLEEYDYSIY